MLTSGDIHSADLGLPRGREAGFPRPVVIVTAQMVLAEGPNVVHVVPLTRTRRDHRSEIELEPDDTNGLDEASAAQCQHLRSVATERIGDRIGHVGAAALSQIRQTIADLIDL